MVQPFNNSVSCTLKEPECQVTNHLYTGETKLTGIKDFDCGNEIINKFVRNNLKAKGKASTSAVHVLLDGAKLVGFFTLSSHSLSRDEYDLKELFGNAPKNVPVFKLDMLGVDLAYQKQKFGQELIALAMENTASVAKVIGCHGMYLDAHKDAVKFYERLGFKALDEPDPIYETTPMFLHLNSILDAVSA
ncbi:GNAT family N-acetyltransferase [Vibrio cholerae]|uniref:GNAT family N-acetyltransferase n=1 Tax=Vibrio cholerae TaxID=666 RepID=UPI001D3D88B8|nr:GNAT family N-acetyltransferase [Vibrio cholerae]